MYVVDIKLFDKNKKKRMENLIHVVRIYNQDIRIEIGIEKWAMLMRSWKQQIAEVIALPN